MRLLIQFHPSVSLGASQAQVRLLRMDTGYNHAGEPVDETGVTLNYTSTGDIFTDTVVHFEADMPYT